MQRSTAIRGRGAQINTSNPFDKYQRSAHLIDFNDGEIPEAPKTSYTDVYPKTIINKVDSPDVPLDWSLNPYQGCEHGCVYCYARNSHEYWGYDAGLDFERKILVKRNAPHLLEKKLSSKNWKAHPIALSGNTDCYQPIEKKTTNHQKASRNLSSVSTPRWDYYQKCVDSTRFGVVKRTSTR